MDKIPPEYLRYALIALGAIVVARLLSRILGRRPAASDIHEDKRCGCGWRGRVSKYNKKCPKCGSQLS
jgi:hypothetical protein